ncbi:NIPSNAP family protein [Roseomonas sp. M0104]|uniref:NIPSNAP family protein n=1 Tax=Teichococcus coralli TaxID=2545983 RepID=A0A845BBN2_9PROT|nr:NIPSNAP family protein [Pseudoroseomonas coralli]MXP63550.1 NIPSNAP family protein [Pseudoroseomonas coralli]
MIVEERIYTLRAGEAGAYLAAYEAEGLAIQRPILGRMVGYYTTEFGPLNQVIHLWAYESLQERTERRVRLLADPAWKAYAAKVRPLVLTQENKLLSPAPFMRVRWQEA